MREARVAGEHRRQQRRRQYHTGNGHQRAHLVGPQALDSSIGYLDAALDGGIFNEELRVTGERTYTVVGFYDNIPYAASQLAGTSPWVIEPVRPGASTATRSPTGTVIVSPTSTPSPAVRRSHHRRGGRPHRAR